MSNENKEPKESSITFNCEDLGLSQLDDVVFGISVKPKGDNELVGKCSAEIKKALKEAGRCK